MADPTNPNFNVPSPTNDGLRPECQPEIQQESNPELNHATADEELMNIQLDAPMDTPFDLTPEQCKALLERSPSPQTRAASPMEVDVIARPSPDHISTTNPDVDWASLTEQETKPDDIPMMTDEETQELAVSQPSDTNVTAVATEPEAGLRPASIIPVYQEQHPLSRHYLVMDSELPTNPAARIAASTTLRMIQQFRNKTLDWMTIDTPMSSVPNGARNSNLATLSRFDCDETFALYIVKDSAGGNLRLVPAHRELVAFDRPDLHFVHLTRHAEDVLNPGPPNPVNFYTGDVIIVFSLKKKPGATINELKKDFSDILDMKKHNFWHVDKFAVVQREVEENQALWRIDDRDPAEKGKRFPNAPRKISCIGYNQNRVVEAKQSHFVELQQQDTKCTAADILIPQLEPATTLRSLLPGEHRHAVIAATSVQPPSIPLKPTVIAVRPLPPKYRTYIQMAPNAFQGRYPDFDLGGQALLWASRFGLAATLAIANKDRDTNSYSTTISRTGTMGRWLIVTFAIRGASGPAPITSWTRSTNFKMDVAGGGVCNLEVETAETDDLEVTIKAKLNWESQDRLNGLSLEGLHAVVWQELESNLHQLRTFPEPQDWLSVPIDSPSGNTLIAITGGPKIEGILPWDRTDIVSFPGSTMELSEQQSFYANSVARTEIEGVIANAMPGVGKTVMVAGTGIHTCRNSKDRDSVQLMTGMTNVCILPIVKALKTLDPDNNFPVVRLISEAHRERLEPALRTSIDYPVLWIEIFKDLLHNVGSSTADGDIRDDQDLRSAIKHLHARKVDPNESTHPFIRKTVGKGIESTRPFTTRAELFRKIYKPRIVVGTVASVLDAFKTPDWALHKDKVATIQIDEASQLPLYALAALALTFRRARVALVGDVRQLPPFEDAELPKDLADFAINRVLQTAARTGALPVINLTVGRRCPPQVTKLYNELFYNQELTSVWSPAKEADLRAFTSALRLNDHFPVQVLDLPSKHTQAGTSLTNIEEAKAAIRIARTIQTRVGTDDVGILCFYKAQAGQVSSLLGDSPFYVGTIDGSQGHEFKAVIILTTRTSPFRYSEFIEDDNRINVAISRTKRLCCVIIHGAMATPGGTWSRLIRKVPSEARTGYAVMSARWPQ